MGDIRVGTSGYSFQSWKGTVYPSRISDSQMFAYYVEQLRFKTLEVNYTYYRLPSAPSMEKFAKKSPAGFDFTVKLFGGITHEPFKSPHPARIDNGLCSEYLEGLRPLAESGKLGCVLAQFPMNVRRDKSTMDYLSRLPDALGGVPMVYEFRNKEWVSEEAVKYLKNIGVGFCAVDEPQLSSLMPLVPEVTSSIAYLRLHGRSPKWFSDPDLRYDYLYSSDELKSFIPAVESMSEKSGILYIAFNNCHAGSAVRNAKTMLSLLDMDTPPVQGELF